MNIFSQQLDNISSHFSSRRTNSKKLTPRLSTKSKSVELESIDKSVIDKSVIDKSVIDKSVELDSVDKSIVDKSVTELLDSVDKSIVDKSVAVELDTVDKSVVVDKSITQLDSKQKVSFTITNLDNILKNITKPDVFIINQNMSNNQKTLEFILNEISISNLDYTDTVCILSRKEYKKVYHYIVKHNPSLNFKAFKIKDTFTSLKHQLSLQREYDTRNLCILDYDLVDEDIYDFMLEDTLRPYNTQFIIICDRYPTTLLHNIQDFHTPVIVSLNNNLDKKFYTRIIIPLVTNPPSFQTFQSTTSKFITLS